MACEKKLLESEAATGFSVLLGTKGKKETLEWCMKANLIASRYECPRCKKEKRLQERKGTVDGYEWRCRSQSKDNPHFSANERLRPIRSQESGAAVPPAGRLRLSPLKQNCSAHFIKYFNLI
ncbi:hypothetical protein TNCV_651881 [Trichonephila clavipes]|nr:hypothetical protein TNCV_651881 [Trichonephila clavipes]